MFTALTKHLERCLSRRMEFHKKNQEQKGTRSQAHDHDHDNDNHAKSGYGHGHEREHGHGHGHGHERYELEIFGYIFRSYTLLQKSNDATHLFARKAIMPLIRTKLSIARLDEGGSRGDCMGLETLLKDVIEDVRVLWGDVLRLVEGIMTMDMDVGVDMGVNMDADVDADAGVHQPQMDLMTEGVWLPILTVLRTDPAIQMAIFSPGIASVFQRNYVVLEAFVGSLAKNLLSVHGADDDDVDDNMNVNVNASGSFGGGIVAGGPSRSFDRAEEKVDMDSVQDTSTTATANATATATANNNANTQTQDEDQLALMALYYQPEIEIIRNPNDNISNNNDIININSNVVNSVQARIYSHSMTSDYSKKWNLPIYYQLRFGQMCARIEEAIHKIQHSNEGWHRVDGVVTEEIKSSSSSSSSSISNDDSAGQFELAFFREVVSALNWFWSGDVFLKPLTHRFLRGTIQIVGRVVSFVREGLDGDVKFGLVEDVRGQVQGPGLGGEDVNGLGQNMPGRLGEGGTGMGTMGINSKSAYEYAWCDRIEDVAAVSWELTVLEKYMVQKYIPSIVDTVCGSSVSTSSSESTTSVLIEEIMMDASKEIKPVVQKIWDEIIVDIMIQKCSSPLLAVKGIAATYRMTNRPPPTQPSPFVNAILRPLHDFNKSISDRIPSFLDLDDQSSSQYWKKSIVDVISERYSTAVSELIETVQRTEEALKNRKARRAMAGGMSDGEKVRLQLYLDQKAFVLSVQGVGIEIETVEGVSKLIALTEEKGQHLSNQGASASLGK